MKTTYEAHMDALLNQVSAIFEGADALDAAHVAAVACAWAAYTSQDTPNKRRQVLAGIIEIMQIELKKMEDNEGQGTLWPQ